MARRKDHDPKELKQLILDTAERIIYSKGLNNLTARALASAVGYTPGTIYNVFRDMDALLLDINYATLGRLQILCLERTKNLPCDFSRVKALAYAYVDFAYENTPAWEMIFANTRKASKKVKYPKYYQERLGEIFGFIETTLRECLKIPAEEAPQTARLLWACLHGITTLTLDGRLTLVGVDDPHIMVDALLEKYTS